VENEESRKSHPHHHNTNDITLLQISHKTVTTSNRESGMNRYSIITKVVVLLLTLTADVSPFEGVYPVGNYSEIVDGIDGTFFLVPRYDTVISNSLKMFGQYEKPARDLVLKFVAEGAIILDVGANIGSWTVPMALHVGPVGRVYSFEIMFQTFSYLVSNIAVNGLANVYPIHASVGRILLPVTVPNIPYYQSGNGVNMGGFSLQIYERFNDNSFETSQVKSVTLDQLLADKEFACPALLKIDVELHELQVLQGATQLLVQCRPVVYLELTCQALSRSILTLLHRLEYVSAWVVKFPVSDAETHHGRTWRSIDPESLLRLGTRVVNVISVPRERRGELKGASGALLDGVYVIDVEGGYFYAAEYNIKLCVGEGRCDIYHQNPENGEDDDEAVMEEEEEEEGGGVGTKEMTHCSGVLISEEDREYWRALVA
jgi:FkbM family methyltransferase